MSYTNDALTQFCKENRVILTKDYSIVTVNSSTFIEGKCANEKCNETFSKQFRTLIRSENMHCKQCNKNEKQKKNEISRAEKNLTVYDNDLFKKFTSEKNLILRKDYSNINVNSNTIIEGTCTFENCNEPYSKRFAAMYLYSVYCKKCTKIDSKNKYKETCVEKYGVENTFQASDFIEKSKKTCLEKYGVENAKQSKEVQEKYKKTCLEKYGFENSFQNEEIKKKSKETCLQNYGVEYGMQNSTIREKSKTTCLEKYGCENVLQNEGIKQKIKETCLEKYGVEHAFQNKDFQEKQKNTCLKKYGCENVFQNEEIKEKSRETMLEKYGVENPNQCDEIKARMRITTKERYGTEYASQSEEVKQKVKNTCLKHFGVEYSLQSKEVREKGIETNIKKYGTRYPMQNAEFSERVSKNAYCNKSYIMPSGKLLSIQGFENLCLDDLLYKENIDENDIINERTKVPELWYEYENGESKRHYVDFYIPSQNRCIEVKSTWTFEKNKEKVLAKQEAAKALGLKYEIRIYDPDGSIIETLY